MVDNNKLVTEYKLALTDLITSDKYRHLLRAFERNQNVKTYNSFVSLLRVHSKLIVKINKNAGVWVSDRKGAVIFNSSWPDDPNGKLVGAVSSNSFESYQARNILYDNEFQTQAVTVIHDDVKKATILQTKPQCKNLFLNVIYVSHKTGPAIAGVGQSSVDATPMWHRV